MSSKIRNFEALKSGIQQIAQAPAAATAVAARAGEGAPVKVTPARAPKKETEATVSVHIRLPISVRKKIVQAAAKEAMESGENVTLQTVILKTLQKAGF